MAGFIDSSLSGKRLLNGLYSFWIIRAHCGYKPKAINKL